MVVYDAGDGREVDSFAAGASVVTQPTCSPNGTRVAAASGALKSLERSRLRFKLGDYHACSLAVLAMSHHKLGNQSKANAFRKMRTSKTIKIRSSF